MKFPWRGLSRTAGCGPVILSCPRPGAPRCPPEGPPSRLGPGENNRVPILHWERWLFLVSPRENFLGRKIGNKVLSLIVLTAICHLLSAIPLYAGVRLQGIE